MNICIHSLRKQVLSLTIAHFILMVVLHLKVMANLYDEVFYHNGNIPIGFHLFINTPFVLFYCTYSACYFGAYRRSRQWFMVFILSQACVVVVLLMIATITGYIKLNERNKNSFGRYDYIVTKFNFQNETYAVSLVNVIGIGSIVFFFLEVYWLVITIKLYRDIRKMAHLDCSVSKYISLSATIH